MNKGFSKNSEEDNNKIEQTKNPKRGLAKILAEKKFTYTLPGKRQINIFATIVLGLNLILLVGIILFLNNQSFHDFIFNVGR
tara:strand:+ start:492 stop:737 length:246 start_codon:yes stop_codon:yes gene_type:complete